MIWIAIAFCCFMLYEGYSTDTTDVVENTTNEMYYPSNEELVGFETIGYEYGAQVYFN